MATVQQRTRHPQLPHRARRVRDLLRSRLLDEEFSGGRLPDEAHLMLEYQVGRGAVRSALAELQREGLIERTQGAGTFPILCKARHRLEQAHGIGFSVASSRTRMATRIVSSQEVAAPADLARHLNVDPGSTCLVVDTVSSIDGTPAVALTSYVADRTAEQRLTEFVRAGSWDGDWYDALAAVDLRPRHREVLVEAVAVDELVAPLLGLRVGAPVMRFERRLLLGDDLVAEYGSSYCRGDLLVFAMTDGSLVLEEAC